ncbi:hypothetical protein evm_013397 [Chilo suppressalis]|nr:hypothetical protein evm_013397 [Chilo suppressalis]
METNVQGDLKQFKKGKADDKKAIMATGGGTFKPQLSEVGAQMLALMGDQLKPLSNNCDKLNYHETEASAEPPLEGIEVSTESLLQWVRLPQKVVKRKANPSSQNSKHRIIIFIGNKKET